MLAGGGLCVYEYIKACSVWCVGVYMYLCIYICACGCVGGGGLLVCIWIDIYNGGLLVFCACVYLSDDKPHPKIKQFSRINTVYMQKSAENRIFCMDICKTI